MLNKLRTDIKQIFSRTNIILVNTGIFIPDSDKNGYSENIWKYNTENLFSMLKNSGVSLQFLKRDESECLFIKHNFKLIKQNQHVLLSHESFSGRNINENYLIVSSDMDDIELFQKSAFSIASCSSPLELKMVSSYVSNFDGVDLFQEIGNIVLRSG